MQQFKKELYEGRIHFRDKHQFELKSEFLHIPKVSTIDYSQEFYIFIPESLQINKETYSKDQFYRDQTNFIRFKTPVFTFNQLLKNKNSPLKRLNNLCKGSNTQKNRNAIQDESKLLGSVIRSALRKRVRKVIDQLTSQKKDHQPDSINANIINLVSEVRTVQDQISSLHKMFMENWSNSTLRQHISYVGQFISATIDFHLTGILKTLRSLDQEEFNQSDILLCSLIRQQNPIKIKEKSNKEERFQYRRGLLNKFILGALKLNINRRPLVNRYHNIIAMTAAAIAMLIFLIGAAVQGEVFIVHSAPFIIATTILYVLKDRIKDGIKAIYHEQATKWFPDYSTEIRTPTGDYQLGTLREVFSHLRPSRIPKEINKVRNRDFHDVLESFRRPEAVMYYKSEVHLKSSPKESMRRYDLNTIFRLNIHRFLEKASDPYTIYTTLDSETDALHELKLPKVYHINIIVRNTFTGTDQKPKEQLQKFRLVIDKEGIKRVEQIWGQKTTKLLD